MCLCGVSSNVEDMSVEEQKVEVDLQLIHVLPKLSFTFSLLSVVLFCVLICLQFYIFAFHISHFAFSHFPYFRSAPIGAAMFCSIFYLLFQFLYLYLFLFLLLLLLIVVNCYLVLSIRLQKTNFSNKTKMITRIFVFTRLAGPHFVRMWNFQ